MDIVEPERYNIHPSDFNNSLHIVSRSGTDIVSSLRTCTVHVLMFGGLIIYDIRLFLSIFSPSYCSFKCIRRIIILNSFVSAFNIS